MALHIMLPHLVLLLSLFSAPPQTQAPAPVPGVTATSAEAPVFDLAAARKAAPDDPIAEAILKEGMDNNQVMHHLDELVNGIGPRLTSSSNLTEACNWAVERFQQFGLKNAHLVQWGEFPVGFDRYYRRGRLVEPIKRPLVFCTHAWTPGTDGPVRGPLRACPGSDEEINAARGSLHNAWIMLGARNKRPKWDSDADDFASHLGRFLDEEGIAGTIVPRGDLIITDGNHDISMDALPHRVSINLWGDDVKAIQQLLDQGQQVVAEFDIAQAFVPGPIPLYDVIAEIPGTEKPEELVIVGGHIDSWDGAGGAQDNGTGVASTLEAARILSQVGAKPKRTIRFMLWSGEEQGIFGSQKYIEQHPEENERVNAVLVHDGGTNACSGIQTTPLMRPLFEQAFAPLIAATAQEPDEDLHFRLVDVQHLPPFIGSDQDSYVALGIPGFFWSQRGHTDYDYIHHTQHDWIDQVDVKYERYNAVVAALGAWRLANTDERVPRGDVSGNNAPAGPRHRLGVSLEDNSLKVTGVMDDGLSAKTLQAGDVILSVDGTALATREDLFRTLNTEGARKKVVVDRGGRKMAFWYDWDKKAVEPAEL